MYINPEELLSMYCLWCSNENYYQDHSNKNEVWKCPQNMASCIKPKKKARISDLDFTNHFLKLNEFMRLINDDDEIVFSSKQKSSSRANASSKRTSYFGVSKNGPNWQSLISINKKKTYVGTFMTEREAGEAFDFYSMLLHRSGALTNFSYTKAQIERLILRFSYLLNED